MFVLRILTLLIYPLVEKESVMIRNGLPMTLSTRTQQRPPSNPAAVVGIKQPRGMLRPDASKSGDRQVDSSLPFPIANLYVHITYAYSHRELRAMQLSLDAYVRLLLRRLFYAVPMNVKNIVMGSLVDEWGTDTHAVLARCRCP